MFFFSAFWSTCQWGGAIAPPLPPGYATVRKGVLIRRIIASHFCTAVGGQQFLSQSRKRQTRFIFERYYFFFHYCLLRCHYVMFHKRILSKPKWGENKQSFGGAWTIWFFRTDGTAANHIFVLVKLVKVLSVKNNVLRN